MASGTCGDNATWELDETTWVLTISGTGAMSDYGSGDQHTWYDYRDSIKCIIINFGITHIGNYVFKNCRAVTSVEIPKSVTTIGEAAFYSCRGLTSITIPESVVTIGKRAFQDCANLVSIIIGKNVSTIGSSGFIYCASVTSIIFLGDKPTLGIDSFTLGYATNAEHLANATMYTTGWGSDDVFTSNIKGTRTTFLYKTIPGVYINVNGTWKKVA